MATTSAKDHDADYDLLGLSGYDEVMVVTRSQAECGERLILCAQSINYQFWNNSLMDVEGYK